MGLFRARNLIVIALLAVTLLPKIQAGESSRRDFRVDEAEACEMRLNRPAISSDVCEFYNLRFLHDKRKLNCDFY